MGEQVQIGTRPASSWTDKAEITEVFSGKVGYEQRVPGSGAIKIKVPVERIYSNFHLFGNDSTENEYVVLGAQDFAAKVVAVDDVAIKKDADDRQSQAKKLIDRAAQKAAEAFRPRELAEVARQFGKRTSDFQRGELDKQVRAAMSIPLSAIERPITDRLEGFAATNVDLIRTVPERYFDRIRLDVVDAFELGMLPDELAEHFADIYDMSDNDAMRIARDQIGKLNGQLNEARQEAMGVTGYVWRGTLDNRERQEHRDLEGKNFQWDDPPDSGTDGEPGHPGEPIQCRCYAEPDLSQILGDAQADPAEDNNLEA